MPLFIYFMDLQFIVVFLLALGGIYFNAIGIRKTNPKRWMRFAGLCISAYIAVIFGLALFRIISSSDVSPYMRWFQGAILVYVIAEARLGSH